jgi:3-phenylpropionate/trans-cinnamate dioxygenase ferredoxin subunit
MAENWVEACREGDLAEEDVKRFLANGRSFALYRAPGGAYSASDAMCTHEEADLTEGFVIGTIIECPMHNGRFDIRTGKAMGAPACVDLRMYPVKVENGRVLVDVAAG